MKKQNELKEAEQIDRQWFLENLSYLKHEKLTTIALNSGTQNAVNYNEALHYLTLNLGVTSRNLSDLEMEQYLAYVRNMSRRLILMLENLGIPQLHHLTTELLDELKRITTLKKFYTFKVKFNQALQIMRSIVEPNSK